MKQDRLIKAKRSLENSTPHQDQKNKNAIYRQMKTCGAKLEDFMDAFPGNSFIDFKELSRKHKRLRGRINTAN